MTSVASSLQCRLMCASACAYGITPKHGAFSAPSPYYDAVGYSSPPVAISGGLENIDAVLIGTNADGVIVAFRGTLAPAETLPSLLDWIQDIFLVVPESVDGLPGKVHTGFYEAVSSLWKKEEFQSTLQSQLSGGKSLFVTGHSKGGPMASIASMLFHNSETYPTPTVYTYASPKPGDGAFAEAYTAAIEQKSYQNYLDIVPFLPPSDAVIEHLAEIPDIGGIFKDAEGWDYVPVGEQLYIDSRGHVVGDYPGLDEIRMTEILAKLGEGKAAEIAQAHCHLCKSADCAGGYMQGACQGEVCS